MINLVVNKQAITVDADPETPLLWVLRDEVGLTGTKYGCGAGLCGACTVHLDGEPVRSCQISVGEIAGQSVTTIEAVETKAAKAIQHAWNKLDVPQCGYCQSGQIMQATALITENATPTDEDIEDAMSGNVCRCASYVRIRKAIHEAAKMMEV